MSTKPKTTQKTGVSGFAVKVLNEGGNAIVGIYDGISYGCSRVKDGCIRIKDGVKKTPEVTNKVSTKVATKAKQLFNEGTLKIDINKLKSLRKSINTESNQLSERIKKRERKIAALYYRIGKEGAQVSEKDNPLEKENIKTLLADVRGYEKEIERLKSRITELESPKVVVAEKEKAVEKPKERNMEKIAKARMARARIENEKQMKATSLDSPHLIRSRSLRSVIQASLKTARFKSLSERAKFETVANDLLDAEKEIRILAAAEMARIGNVAAVPILISVTNDTDPFLLAETINSLILLGDPRALNVLKEKVTDPHYRVRIASLRGLYKMADEDLVKMACIEAIKDEHPEVRKTAINFIGWKDFSEGVPPLVQCLKDEDDRVKKSAISSLANIRDKAAVIALIKLLNDPGLEIREKALAAIQMIVGEKISFDIQLTGDALSKAQKNLKQWWQQKRISLAQESDLDLLDKSIDEFSTFDQTMVRNEMITDVSEIAIDPPNAEGETSPEEKRQENSAQTEKEEVINPAESKPEYENQDGPAEEKSEDNVPTKEELKKMNKAALIMMCNDLDIVCDETFTKNRIIRSILDKQKE